MSSSTTHRPLPSIVVELGRVPEVDLRAGLGRRRFDELVRSGTLLPPQSRPRPSPLWLAALAAALLLAAAAFLAL